MTLSPLFPPGFRFVHLMRVLCLALDRCGRDGGMPRSFVELLWCRLQDMGLRFARLAERVAAGKVAAPAEPAPRVRAASRARTGYSAPVELHADGGFLRVPGWMQCRSGWLVALVPEAAAQTDALHALMADAEVLALASASPGIGRMLRSACRMLGVEPVAALRLPPRVKRPPQPKPVRPKVWEPPLHLPSVGRTTVLPKRLQALVDRRRAAAEAWEAAAAKGDSGA